MLIWRIKMTDEFEAVMLGCGHSVNSYNGLGVCYRCNKKTCGKCLQLVVDELLCPRCFADQIRPVSE